MHFLAGIRSFASEKRFLITKTDERVSFWRLKQSYSLVINEEIEPTQQEILNQHKKSKHKKSTNTTFIHIIYNVDIAQISFQV